MTDDLVVILVGSLVATRVVGILLGGPTADRLPYLILLCVDIAAIAIARLIGEGGAALGFVAECAGLILVFAPGALDALELRAERRGDTRGRRYAVLVARLREILVPGRASTQRRRALDQRSQAAAGDGERLIAEITAEAATVRDPARARQLHVELVLLLIAAGRATEALSHVERHLGAEVFESSPVITAAVATALCTEGRLRDAARLLALLETQAAGRDLSAQPLLLPTRLAFIAGAGLSDELTQLLAQKPISSAIAGHEEGRLRTLAAAQVSDDAEAKLVARELAGRLLELGSRAAVPIIRRAPLTLVLVAVNLAAMLLITAFGLGTDELGLARAGALFRPAVLAGEWWRLVTAMFLHAGAFHLLANMYGLYLLGRATEELLSWQRFLIVYALSGLGGGLASLWADRGISVGASGAIMGVLAALTVIVFARRHSFHPAARRMLLGNLLFLGALQAFLGWQIPMIDSAAHGGGFVAGLLATAGLAPSRELTRGVRGALTAVALVLAAAFVAAGVLAARQPLSATLLLLPTAEVIVADTRLTVPSSWTRDASGLLVDRHLGIEVRAERVSPAAPGVGELRLHSPQADDARVKPLLERIWKSQRPASEAR